MSTPSPKNIVVTGVSSGIGKAICHILIEKGYRVFGSVRKPADAQDLIAAYPDMFEPMIFDVCDREAIAKLRENASPRWSAMTGSRDW